MSRDAVVTISPRTHTVEVLAWCACGVPVRRTYPMDSATGFCDRERATLTTLRGEPHRCARLTPTGAA